MSALMEDIREAVLAVLPSLPEDKVQSLLNKLESIAWSPNPICNSLKRRISWTTSHLSSAGGFSVPGKLKVAGMKTSVFLGAECLLVSRPQLHWRNIHHVNSGNALSRRKKQKRVSSAPEDIARGPADQYGCVRWQPDCPTGETVEGLKEKKSEMKDLYHTEGPAGAERGYVIQLMKTTYYLQRKNINASPPPSIAELKTEWPYLFTPREVYSHFNLLTDINILEKMEQAMEEKGKLILRFFQHKTAGTSVDEIKCILVKYNKEEKV
ncbi:uncharacterized protein LOC109141728 [Scomber scombrus]|uniref:Uncharacterized protein LOC109141728 n=1 Tax=Scomber scombrus TaxID=13677 RepID=A0AAV1QIX1_SCOSC